jgi:hypothetical protein
MCHPRTLYKKYEERKMTERKNMVLGIHLTQADYEKVFANANKTMCRSLSDYGRRQLLNLPVTMQYRNRSADDVVESNIMLIAVLKQYLNHPSWTEAEKEWLRTEIGKLEEATFKIFSLCLPK